MKIISPLVLSLFFLYLPASLRAQTGEITMNYKVSMDNPSQHYFHVEFIYEGLDKQTIDLKMPVWTPGYYMILDLSKYVINFKAVDNHGNELVFIKTDKNTWQIKTGNSQVIKVDYDVFAYVQTVGHPFLDDGRGFISPTGVFMYVDGCLDHPVNVTVRPYAGWHNVATGLSGVDGVPDTWHAEDFDELYDCPILVGNLNILSFRVMNIRHYIAMEDMPDIDTISHLQPGIYLGIGTYDRGNSLVISNVEWNSPAWFAGLSPRDTILELNGKIASSAALNDAISSGQPGNEVLVRIGRRTGRYNFSIISGPNKLRTFAITPLSQPDPLQSKILNNWLTN